MTERYFGIDFGTTNSAISVCGPTGPAEIIATLHDGRAYETFRSVLFYELEEKARTKTLLRFAGPAAIEAYDQAGGLGGRFIQSIKSYLADPHFTQTSVFGSARALADLIGDILIELRRKAEERIGPIDGPVVVGRPARFVGDSPIEKLALERLTDAYGRAGFTQFGFEYEPVGAAYHVEQGLNRDALVLIADFGGGTSDFCILRIGPKARAAGNRAGDILGVGGIGLAGDAFDARLIDHAIAPGLGRDAVYRGQTGTFLPMPRWIYGELARWHRLAFLDRPETRQVFREVLPTVSEPEAIEGLQALIQSHRGFDLSKAVESAKIALSDSETAALHFDIGPVSIRRQITRSMVASWLGPDLDQIDGVVDQLLTRAKLAATDIDRVFLTGGSSRLVALKQRFEARFGAAKMAQADALSSVANGLALSARDRAQSNDLARMT